MRKYFRSVVIFILVAAFLLALPVSAKTPTYCIAATPAITEATYQYLNDIYIEQYPELALEYSFGSERDKNTLKKLADDITKNKATDKDKVNAIVAWVDKNIEYVSYTSGEAEYFAIDTYYAQKGNCLGISQLIVHLCRLSDIPAVMCGGTRGNMAEYITLDDRETDHAWAMIYFDGSWRLYDPLFDVYGQTDRTFISRWYFTDFIEGVSPYVKEYATYINHGNNIFYIDGRFMYYRNGMPASEFFGTAAHGGMSVNGAIPYFTINRYVHPTGYGDDGHDYIENPARQDAMINDECYTDGWISYGGSMQYVKPNGILAGATLKEYNGACYYLPYYSDAINLPGKSADYTFTEGFPTLIKGESIKVELPWEDEETNKYGRVLAWNSETPETASVTADGKITALSEGFASITVCSKDPADPDTHHMFSYVEFWVTSGERTMFADIPAGQYYADAVNWAVDKNITTGTDIGTFSPGNPCTRAQIVTFLWRAAGQPEPASSKNPFTDVKEGQYYYKAVLWAVEKGITNGLTKTTFGPDQSCERGQVVTFLWRDAGKPTPTSKINPFTDVTKAYYYDAMLWAVENGITNGLTKTTFGPKATCQRGQIVTFLYRSLGNE